PSLSDGLYIISSRRCLYYIMEERTRTRFKLVVGLVLLLVALLLFRRTASPTSTKSGASRAAQQATPGFTYTSQARHDCCPPLGRVAGPPQSAGEIVASKLVQFAANRRKLMSSLARRTGKPVPPEVEHFFDALEKGHWEEADAIFDGLHK